MPPADNMPDFDSMSQEELMAWMESLAKRQGANAEELITSADVEIPEIDPDSVVIDEPGYVPYGQERPEPPARETPRPAPPPEPRISQSGPPPRPQTPPPAPEPEPEPSAPDDGLAWLESLAADQSDLLFNLDLNALTDEIERHAQDKAEEAANPMAWLENLASEETSIDLSALTADDSEPPQDKTETETVTDPFASGVDPMAWLENLARRQGAKSEELTTSTPMNIPVPENVVIDEPGYKPFSFDAPIEPRRPAPAEPLKLDDPTEWLDSLAGSQGFDEERLVATDEAEEAKNADAEIDEQAIQQAIEAGTVSPEQMQAFLERQADLYVKSLEEEARLGDNEPPVPAELPDWLLEQVGPPPEGGWPPSETGPVLTEDIPEPPAVTDFPDWLKEDLPTEGELDFDSIFADAGDLYEAPEEALASLDFEIDPNDPWVEAFDLEQQGLDDPDAIPEWYTRNISDPERIAAVERLVRESGEQLLAEANLPEETTLEAGELINLPDWLRELAEDEEPLPVEAGALGDDVPDWLRELDSPAEADLDAMPEWLVESLDDKAAQEEAVAVMSRIEPPSPATREPLVPQPALPAESLETLETARSRAREGNLSDSLLAYEQLIRGNLALEAVVEDLQSLARQHRDQPAVLRVLGDGFMRLGKLQAALDTYREALNHL